MEPTPQSSRLTWLAVAMGAGGCALLASVGADARWLAALGRTILAQGSVPAGIPYAAAPSVGWVNVPVLGELVFHALQVAGGDRGFLIAQLVATAAALTLLALGMRALGAPDAARAVVLMLVFFAAAPSFLIVRAQLFSLLLFCVVLLLLRAESRSPSRRVWLLVPLIALWANLHGARRARDRRCVSGARTRASRAGRCRERSCRLLRSAVLDTGARGLRSLLPRRAPQ